jgi:hypothetical protein
MGDRAPLIVWRGFLGIAGAESLCWIVSFLFPTLVTSSMLSPRYLTLESKRQAGGEPAVGVVGGAESGGRMVVLLTGGAVGGLWDCELVDL